MGPYLAATKNASSSSAAGGAVGGAAGGAGSPAGGAGSPAGGAAGDAAGGAYVSAGAGSPADGSEGSSHSQDAHGAFRNAVVQLALATQHALATMAQLPEFQPPVALTAPPATASAGSSASHSGGALSPAAVPPARAYRVEFWTLGGAGSAAAVPRAWQLHNVRWVTHWHEIPAAVQEWEATGGLWVRSQLHIEEYVCDTDGLHFMPVNRI